MSKKKDSKPKEPSKDEIIARNHFYIKKLEQTVANQAVIITQLETNIDILNSEDRS